MLERWRGCHPFHQCSHHLSFLTCLAFLLLMRSRISHMSTIMNSQMISSMGTHMSRSVSTTGTHRGSILSSPQGSRTLVQRFTADPQVQAALFRTYSRRPRPSMDQPGPSTSTRAVPPRRSAPFTSHTHVAGRARVDSDSDE